jgi:hypothetical protein
MSVVEPINVQLGNARSPNRLLVTTSSTPGICMRSLAWSLSSNCTSCLARQYCAVVAMTEATADDENNDKTFDGKSLRSFAATLYNLVSAFHAMHCPGATVYDDSRRRRGWCLRLPAGSDPSPGAGAPWAPASGTCPCMALKSSMKCFQDSQAFATRIRRMRTPWVRSSTPFLGASMMAQTHPWEGWRWVDHLSGCKRQTASYCAA